MFQVPSGRYWGKRTSALDGSEFRPGVVNLWLAFRSRKRLSSDTARRVPALLNGVKNVLHSAEA